MNAIVTISQIAFLLVLGTSSLARAATPVLPDKRDGQVLEATLLHLLADPKFDMVKVPTNEAVIVLHVRTPQTTGFIQPHQMRGDVGGHALPADAVKDLRKRNLPQDAKPDDRDAVAASFTNLVFGERIVVADLTEIWSKGRRSYGAFGKAHPKARGWAMAYLPGFSKDGTVAIVRANVGPSPHGALVTAVLEKTGDKWVVKWHHIARFV